MFFKWFHSWKDVLRDERATKDQLQELFEVAVKFNEPYYNLNLKDLNDLSKTISSDQIAEALLQVINKLLHSVLKVPILAHFSDETWHRNQLALIGWEHLPTRFILP